MNALLIGDNVKTAVASSIGLNRMDRLLNMIYVDGDQVILRKVIENIRAAAVNRHGASKKRVGRLFCPDIRCSVIFNRRMKPVGIKGFVLFFDVADAMAEDFKLGDFRFQPPGEVVAAGMHSMLLLFGGAYGGDEFCFFRRRLVNELVVRFPVVPDIAGLEARVRPDW